MAVTALDTHEVVKELIAAGFTDVQAEAVTRQLRLAQNIDLSNLMTKADGAALENSVKVLENSLKTEIKVLETSLKTEMKVLETSLKTEMAMLDRSFKANVATTKSDLERSQAETKSELLKWMVGTLGVQTVIILGTVVTLIRIARSQRRQQAEVGGIACFSSPFPRVGRAGVGVGAAAVLTASLPTAESLISCKPQAGAPQDGHRSL